MLQILSVKGISQVGEVVDLGSDLDIIQKSGAWFAYNGEKIGQGRENAKVYLTEHPEIYKKIFEQILDHYKISYKK